MSQAKISQAKIALAVRRENKGRLTLLHHPTSSELLAGDGRPAVARGPETEASLRMIYVGEALIERRDKDEIRGWSTWRTTAISTIVGSAFAAMPLQGWYENGYCPATGRRARSGVFIDMKRAIMQRERTITLKNQEIAWKPALWPTPNRPRFGHDADRGPQRPGVN